MKKKFLVLLVTLCILFGVMYTPVSYAAEIIGNADNIIQATTDNPVANGVYYLKNTAGQYLTTNLSVTSSKQTVVPGSLSQLWKVYYVGDGTYTLRPMDSLGSCLNAAGMQLSFYYDPVDNTSNLSGHSRWKFIASSDGYKIKSYTYQWTLKELGIASNSDVWTFERISSPPSGVLIKASVSWIAPASTATFKASVYSGSTISQSVTWSSSNTNVATVNSAGVVTGVSQGTAIITAKSTYNTSWSASCTVNVGAVPNGPYYIRNKETNKYLDIKGPSTDLNANIHQWQFYGHNSQKWIIELQQDGYYTIKSVYSSLYLTVQDNSSQQNAKIIQSDGGSADGQRWKFTKLSKGGYKISAKCGENSDKCLAVGDYVFNVDGIEVQHKTYANEANRQDEWEFAFVYVHYYDNSMSDDMISKISNAHDTASKAFYDTFDIRFAYKGDPVHYDGIITEACRKLPGFSCDSSCGALSECDKKHHKNIFRISDQLYSNFRESNHVYVLWTNRFKTEYCVSTNGLHKIVSAMAVVCYSRPIIHIMQIDNTSSDTVKASMGINLIHETAHTFGLEEQYILAGHGVDNDYVCCMEEYKPNMAYEFYTKIKRDGKNAFCDSCKNKMSNLLYDCWHLEYLPQ